MTKPFLHRVAIAAISMLVFTTMIVVGTSAPAHAVGWLHNDNMEPGVNRPEDRFAFDSDDAHDFGWFRDLTGGVTAAHSGSYVAELNHFFSHGTWVSVGKSVQITPKTWGNVTQCQFSAWVYAGSSAAYNIEVIEPVTWRYITVSRVNQPTAWTWSKISTTQFVTPVADVFIRVAYLAPNFTAAAYVDDFSLTCTF